jgi:hypothetical protein
MTKSININGRPVVVLNTLSCGPGCEPDTYNLKGGSYVYRIAGEWWLQVRGQFKRRVIVEKGGG